MAITKIDLEELEERLNEKMRLLPTRDEFLKIMDEVMGKPEAIQNEQTIMGHQVTNHEDRITLLEGKQTPALQP